MTDSTEPPTDRNGNEILERGTIAALQPEKRPNLQLVQGRESVDHILDHIGVDQDHDSVIAEDTYSCLWVNVEDGEYTEVWGSHANIPYTHKPVYRLR